MTERMADEKAKEIEQYANQGNPSWVIREMKRARTSEKALAEALRDSAPRLSPSHGPCWCPPSAHDIPATEQDHGVLCIQWRSALRAAGFLP